MYFHGTAKVNGQGHLEIGGCDVADFAQQFGTPLYIVDEALVRQRAREYVDAFPRIRLEIPSGIRKQGVQCHGNVSNR